MVGTPLTNDKNSFDWFSLALVGSECESNNDLALISWIWYSPIHCLRPLFPSPPEKMKQLTAFLSLRLMNSTRNTSCLLILNRVHCWFSENLIKTDGVIRNPLLALSSTGSDLRFPNYRRHNNGNSIRSSVTVMKLLLLWIFTRRGAKLEFWIFSSDFYGRHGRRTIPSRFWMLATFIEKVIHPQRIQLKVTNEFCLRQRQEKPWNASQSINQALMQQCWSIEWAAERGRYLRWFLCASTPHE